MKVVIPEVRVRAIEGGEGRDAYAFRVQTMWLQRKADPFPVEFEYMLRGMEGEKRYEAPYPVGEYDIDAEECVYVGNNGKLQFRAKLTKARAVKAA